MPGPGTYGKGGIPHALMEEKQLKSASTVGLLDAGSSGKRQLPEVVRIIFFKKHSLRVFLLLRNYFGCT